MVLHFNTYKETTILGEAIIIYLRELSVNTLQNRTKLFPISPSHQKMLASKSTLLAS